MKRRHIPIGDRRLASLAGALLALGLTAYAQPADVRTGLVAYWPFEGNFEDSVGIFDGTENGTEAIPFVNGKAGFGKAIKLNGEDQFVEITGGEPDDLAFAGGSVSIAAWYKVDAFDTSWQALVAKGEGSNWRVARNNASGTMSYAGGLTDATGTIDVTDGNWHHIVAISDAAGASWGTAIYVDGVLDGQIAGAAALVANGSRVMIGENPGARSREWEGEIDDVAIWNRVLTEAEITSLWSNGAGKPLSAFFAPPGDADNDGMPDQWEAQYASCCALNPNDASDAAKDCNGNGRSNLDEYKAGTDPCDTAKPTIVSAVSSATFNTVDITFSEALDPATATVAANYTITPALAVTAAAYRNRVVTLTTAAQTPGGTAYTVTVTGVKDLSNWEIPAGSNTATFFTYFMTKNGVLEFSFWGNISGTPVQGLYDDPRYPASPDWTGAVFSFNSRDILPTDVNENYGATMKGYLTPTQSGDYRFFIYSDDASQLFLGADDKPVDPLTSIWIAEEPGCCNAFSEPDGVHTRTSEPIPLVAGKKYYILLVYKEGGGGDYGQVAWRREGDPTPAASLTPIPGKYLSSAVDLPYPAEGLFLTRTPAPNAKNVAPDAAITIVHSDGKTPWTADNVSLKLDGATVTATITKDVNEVTITYKPGAMFASMSTHTITLGHPDPNGQPTTTEWSFEVAEWKGPLLDKVKGYPAIMLGAAAQTDDKGGHTGASGDRALDAGTVNGVGYVADASFLNAATADNTLTIAFFQKLRSVRASSSFWANSPSSNNGTRGYQAHVPWSDSNIYFDTSGCCTADTQRINLLVDASSVPDYTDATWWQQWRHFAFVKDGATKYIYINGKLFHQGGGDPLKTDFTTLLMGGGPLITDNRMDGMLDDFVIYNGALTEAQALSLSGGAAPSSIAGLIAHWDFNDVIAAAPTISIARDGANVRITFTGSLQSADVITGPWTAVTGSSPLTQPANAVARYFRSAQ